MKHSVVLVVSIIAALFIGSSYYYYSPMYPKVTKAIAVIHPTKGNNVSGVVTFEHIKDGLLIKAKLKNLTPGKHGFHVHALGDCSCPDATCAGDHFNPTNKPHGGPNDLQRHVGDFGNVEADTHGTAIYERIDTVATLNGPRSIVGRAIIIHADEDDLTSQPTGNAGARVGCGVIGVAAN